MANTNTMYFSPSLPNKGVFSLPQIYLHYGDMVYCRIRLYLKYDVNGLIIPLNTGGDVYKTLQISGKFPVRLSSLENPVHMCST